ncbi:Aste57867_7549 [Aphanomyces stellatus]|uniref:Aste57867_7549 protein n=1 Tax=Aphanomyces stellatus TaxID=120398 RepID=A0A485KIH5_9STRA|nr:hypothetical protein As57867_007523 [Aphanomyces stellatus]VFT84458.1 Aste57867_7549 [Aphanomyces stellatus]
MATRMTTTTPTDNLSLVFGPAAPLSQDGLLHQAFEARALLHPDRIAMESDHQWLSFGQLDALANTAANKLTGMGVTPMARVAVLMDPGFEFAVGMLAALKIGAAFVPVHATSEADNLLLSTNVVVSTDAHRDCLRYLNKPTLYLDCVELAAAPATFEAPFQAATSADDAWIVRGEAHLAVGVSHQAAMNVAVHGAAEVGIQDGSRVLLPSVDSGGFMMHVWLSLLNGATIVLGSVNRHLPNVHVFVCGDADDVTAMAANCPNLKVISMTGGHLEMSKAGWPPVRLVSLLRGPPECAFSTPYTESSTKPLANVNQYVLDRQRQPVSRGDVGELYVGGLCVAHRGYLNGEDNNRFLLDPFAGSGVQRMFRTGELGRMRPNGSFEVIKQVEDRPSHFWREILRDIHETNRLSLSKPTKATLVDPVGSVNHVVQLSQLDDVCQQLGVPPSAIFQAAWAVVLKQYTQSDTVLFGTVLPEQLSDNSSPDLRTLPFLVRVPSGTMTSNLIANVHSNARDMAVHWSYLADVQEWTKQNVSSLDTLFLFDRAVDKANLQVASREGPHLALTIHRDCEGQYHVAILFNRVEMDRDIMTFLSERYLAVASKLASLQCIEDTIDSFDGPCAPERNLMESFCYGPLVPLPFELLHLAFEARAKSSPHLRAIEFMGEWLSYGQLNARANALACDLTNLGVGVGSRVAVIMERCLEFPIGLLAALKAGAATMPLDASYPAPRLAFIVSDASASVVITTTKHKEHIQKMNSDIPILIISAEMGADFAATFEPAENQRASRYDEAFIVYTSGSTGKPKGVPVLHIGAANAIRHVAAGVEFSENTRVMQFMAIGFDACQWEIWKSLSCGATVVFRSDDVMRDLATVDVLMCTPTGLSILGDPILYPSLKYVSVIGEVLPTSLKDTWCPYVCFVNVYGPAECAIFTHSAALDLNSSVTVGTVIENVRSYVLGTNKRPVPIGVVGEMYLAGVCVSPGYINLPEQSAKSFLTDPFVQNGGLMYRTGDLGRMLPNGNFEILGRQDSQVKLKGYRIELDEVAEAMLLHPGVISAAAIVKDKTHLVGYFTPADISIPMLQQTVESHLPFYMVPAEQCASFARVGGYCQRHRHLMQSSTNSTLMAVDVVDEGDYDVDVIDTVLRMSAVDLTPGELGGSTSPLDQEMVCFYF